MARNVAREPLDEHHPYEDVEYWTREFNITSYFVVVVGGKDTLIVEAENIIVYSQVCCGMSNAKRQGNFADFMSIHSCFGLCNSLAIGSNRYTPGCWGIGKSDFIDEIEKLVEIRKRTHGAHAQINMLEGLVGRVENLETDVRQVLTSNANQPPEQAQMNYSTFENS
eukprot:Platyproteum_vivax@DN17138_c0_g1_i1.p1